MQPSYRAVTSPACSPEPAPRGTGAAKPPWLPFFLGTKGSISHQKNHPVPFQPEARREDKTVRKGLHCRPSVVPQGPAHHQDLGPDPRPPAHLSRSHAFLEIELMPYFCSKGTEAGISPILQMGKRRPQKQSNLLFLSVARTQALRFPDELFLRLPPPSRRLLCLNWATRLCRGQSSGVLDPRSGRVTGKDRAQRRTRNAQVDGERTKPKLARAIFLLLFFCLIYFY